jgi:succinyl-CoA synthetase beta subunit
MKLVVKPDMLFGKRGKSGLVALNLDLAQVRQFVKERLGVEVVRNNIFPCFTSASLIVKAIYNLYVFSHCLG